MEESVRFKPTGGFNPLSVYPIGSIYLSTNGTNPADLFGGTWTQLKDRFLLAAGDKYAAGSTGGEAEHLLTTDELPWHTHNDTFWNDDFNQMGDANTDANVKKQYPGLVYDVAAGHDAWNHPTEGAGGSQPHNNLPPYLAVYMWQRVA